MATDETTQKEQTTASQATKAVEHPSELDFDNVIEQTDFTAEDQTHFWRRFFQRHQPDDLSDSDLRIIADHPASDSIMPDEDVPVDVYYDCLIQSDFFRYLGSDHPGLARSLTTYQDWWRTHIQKQADQVRSALIDLAENDRVEIYRRIDVEPGWVDDLKEDDQLGTFWADSADSAQAHWSDGSEVELLLHGQVKPTDIDWRTTASLRLKPTLAHEDEIRPVSSAPIRLVEVIDVSADDGENKLDEPLIGVA